MPVYPNNYLERFNYCESKSTAIAQKGVDYYNLHGRKVEKIYNTTSYIIDLISHVAGDALIGLGAVYQLMNRWALAGALLGGSLLFGIPAGLFKFAASNIKERFLAHQRHLQIKEDLLADPTCLEPVDPRIAHHQKTEKEILGNRPISLQELKLRSDRLGLVDTATRYGAMAKVAGSKFLQRYDLPLPVLEEKYRNISTKRAPGKTTVELRFAQDAKICNLLLQAQAEGCRSEEIEKYANAFAENLTKNGNIYQVLKENKIIIDGLKAMLPSEVFKEFEGWIEESRSMEKCFTDVSSLRDFALGKQLCHLLKDEKGKAALLERFSDELTAAGKSLEKNMADAIIELDGTAKGMRWLKWRRWMYRDQPLQLPKGVEKDLNKLTDDAIVERLFSMNSNKKWELLYFVEGQLTMNNPKAPVYVDDLLDLRIGLQELKKDTKNDFEKRATLLAKQCAAVEYAIATERKSVFSQIAAYLFTFRKPAPFEKTSDLTLRAIHSNLKMIDNKLFRLRVVSHATFQIMLGLIISTLIVPHPAYFFSASGVILLVMQLVSPLLDRRIKKLEGQITDLRHREFIHLKRGTPTVDAFELDKEPKNADAVKEFKKSQAQIDKAYGKFLAKRAESKKARKLKVAPIRFYS